MFKARLFSYGIFVCLGIVSASLSMDRAFEDESSPMDRGDAQLETGHSYAEMISHQMHTYQDDDLTKKQELIQNEVATLEGYRQIIIRSWDHKTSSEINDLMEENVFLEVYDNIISGLTDLLNTVNASTTLEEIKNRISQIQEEYDPMDADLM